VILLNSENSVQFPQLHLDYIPGRPTQHSWRWLLGPSMAPTTIISIFSTNLKNTYLSLAKWNHAIVTQQKYTLQAISVISPAYNVLQVQIYKYNHIQIGVQVGVFA
jgi:hypothetical protein